MNKNILTCSAKILISKLLFPITFLSLSGLQGPLEADQNNTSFIVADGNLEAPFYTLTFESNGSIVNFQTYPLRKGNTYFFKGGNISASHPFNIGSSHNVSSSHAVGGPLDQNSGANGQSITVTIPNDFQGTLAYYCTIHNTMIRQFTLAETSPGGGEPQGLPVFALDATQAGALSASAPGAGNYTFEFYTDPATGTELREMVAAEEVGGQWQRTTDPGTGEPLVYPLESIYPDMESVKTYLGNQGITDGDALGYITDGDAGGDGPHVYFLNSDHLLALTGSASAQEGNYSIVEQDDGQGPYLVIKPMELVAGNWQED
ncbi:MAG: hypothetical protein EBU27_10310, partial [Opitutae bacterium]|nr:hypothetical protein [Opitutae bacterium]